MYSIYIDPSNENSSMIHCAWMFLQACDPQRVQELEEQMKEKRVFCCRCLFVS